MAELAATLNHATPLLGQALAAQGQGVVAIFAPNPLSAALCGLAALNAGASILLLPGAPDDISLQALRERGDVKAVVALSPDAGMGAKGLHAINLASLLPTTQHWITALPAATLKHQATPVDIAHAAALTAPAFEALCAALTAQVRPLSSDTSLSVLPVGRETLALTLAAHAWTAGACWQPVAAQDEAPSAWQNLIRQARPGVIHLPGGAW